MASHTVVVFLSHVLTPALVAEFERLKDVRDDTDTIFCYDNSRNDFSGRLFARPPRLLLFTLDDLVGAAYPRKGRSRRFHPGNQDLVFLHVHRRLPGYRHYWFIEHDVRFSGPWESLLSAAASSEADLLGTTLRDRAAHPTWRFWDTLVAPHEVDPLCMTRGFFPVVRLSPRALAACDDAYAAGWDGHFEATMPTILRHRGYTLEDLGGDGPYVPPGHTNRFYTNTPLDPLLAPGTLVFRPRRDQPGSIPHMLWHPVKRRADRTWKFRAWRHRLDVWRVRRLRGA